MTDPLLIAVLEIKELLKLIAEPQLAQRDEKNRSLLRATVGKSLWKQKVIPHLDGTKTQTDIRNVVKVDRSDLAKFIRALRATDLLVGSEKPHLNIDIPATFFQEEKDK